MFSAALFTIAKTQKQPKYPSINEWIKKIWFIYTMEYYSVIKKERNSDFPSGPVAKTLHTQCRGPGFDPWLGN